MTFIKNDHKVLIDEVVHLLQGGNAHADLKKALAGLPGELRGEKPGKLPYSIWQLLEHIRIAQWDMLEFCKSSSHQSPEWPNDYWPKETGPKNDTAWDNSIRQINENLEELINLVETGNLFGEFSYGDGQSLLREALQVADHTSYHVAEIIVIRRLLAAW